MVNLKCKVKERKMKKLNRKGFTLVELLAVIVILALIMSIAIYSISGILQSSRLDTFRESGIGIISGVKQKLILANDIKAGVYYFDKSILESGGELTPYGDTIVYGSSSDGTAVSGASGVYYAASATCQDTGKSFVVVTEEGDHFEYGICLVAGANKKYLEGTERQLMGKDDTVLKQNNA